MRALHIRTRNDLIKYATDHAPYRAIERALEEGIVENLGAFAIVQPNSNLSGWIIKITSKITDKVWFLAVFQNHLPGCGRMLINKILWKHWIGDRAPDNPLYAGDNPETYFKERDNGKT